MCGILGIVASPGRPPRPERASLVRMRDAMSSCGPDGAGLFERRNVAFAHLRLAICDHTGGGQPWLSDDGQCVLVYNGEIYNDIELRRELNALGRRFRSFCDTEVVMEAYREWGVDCVRRFRGMFAFGLYDFEQDRLLLVCDRFGIKPLFLTEVDGDLVFASSIAALVQHPRFSKSSSIPAISHYLATFRITLGRETLFAGVRQLLPGERLIAPGGETRIDRYWEYPDREDAALRRLSPAEVRRSAQA